MTWNKQMSYDFDRTAQYNIKAVDTMWRFLIGIWVEKGKPVNKEDFLSDPFIKSIWIRFSGIIDRCNKILRGEE